MPNLSNKIRVFRHIRDSMTQAQLAQATGVSRQTIIALERGKYNPSVYLALRIARALGATVDELFCIEEEE